MNEFEIVSNKLDNVLHMVPLTNSEIKDRKCFLTELLNKNLISKNSFDSEINGLSSRFLNMEQLISLRSLIDDKIKLESNISSELDEEDDHISDDYEEEEIDMTDPNTPPPQIEKYEELVNLLDEFASIGYSFNDISNTMCSVDKLRPDIWNSTMVTTGGTLRDFRNNTIGGYCFNKKFGSWKRKIRPEKIDRCIMSLKLFKNMKDFNDNNESD